MAQVTLQGRARNPHGLRATETISRLRARHLRRLPRDRSGRSSKGCLGTCLLRSDTNPGYTASSSARPKQCLR